MEVATEHVRMLDAGRQQLGYSSPLTTPSFSSVTSTKTQLLQHGNGHGLSLVASETGFVVVKHDELEASCADYVKRRQEAVDHGQKLTLEEIHALPMTREVRLPSIAYWIALSPDESVVAVAYGGNVALFEVAHILEAETPSSFYTFSGLQVQEIAWCKAESSEDFAVLTVEKQVFVCTMAGAKRSVDTESESSSICWSPTGEQLAIGSVDGTIGVYGRNSLNLERSVGQPECCSEGGFEVHHINWAETDLMLAGYHKYDENDEETTAMACLFEKDDLEKEKCVELDEVVGFFDVENRRHQYFSAFLPDWRMFFIGCSLSADIELVVSDPDGGEWELWKPTEKYQARLPMNADDEESYPMGFALNLNSTAPVPVDDDNYPPAPIIVCSNTEGLLVNFAFVDTTVRDELEFVKAPSPFVKEAIIRTVTVESKTDSPKRVISHEYGQNDENEFAKFDGEDSDDEEERREEEEKARTTFRSIATDGTDYITSEHFAKLFKQLGATYSEDEHGKTMQKLEKDGKVYEEDFVSWYLDWIFGDEDSDDEDDDANGSAPSRDKKPEMKSKEEIAAALAKFTAKEGSWKCGVCMVNNDREAVKCASCETPNPDAPKLSAPSAPASASAAGAIGTGGFSFPGASSGFSFGAVSSASTGASKPTGFSFGAAPSSVADANKGTGFSFGAAKGTGFNFPTSAKSVTKIEDATTTSKDERSASSKKVISHEYGQNAENEFAEPEDDESDDEEDRREEEENARLTFRAVAGSGTDYITPEDFAKLFKALGATYAEEVHGQRMKTIEKEGKVHMDDFVEWYLDWIFNDEESDEEVTSSAKAPKKVVSHEYGQNDENEFAKFDGEDSDDEEERREEEEKARTTFRSIATDGTDYVTSEHFAKLFKQLGATYSEDEHGKTMQKLEKDGKVYEEDFVSWYLDWIFGDEDSDDEDDDANGSAPSSDKKPEMKSKEEIAAALAKFTAKEGSWKCGVCMVNNDREAVKCASCETPNPDAPKLSAPSAPASASAAGAIGTGGFSFPGASSGFSFGAVSSASTGASKPTGFSFGAAPSSVADANKGTGFSFGAATGTGLNSQTNTKPTDSKPADSGSAYPPDTSSKPKPPAFGATGGSSYPPDTSSKPKLPAFGASSGSAYPPDTSSKPKPPAFGAVGGGYPPDTSSKPKPPSFGATGGSAYPPDTSSKPKPPAFGASSGSSYPPDTSSKPKPPAFGAAAGGYPPDTSTKPKPPAFGASTGSAYPPDTSSKPKPPAFGASSAYPPDTSSKPKPPVFGQSASSDKPTSSFGFGSFGKSLFGSAKEPSESSSQATEAANTATPTKPKSLFSGAFGSGGNAGSASDTSSSPFGVVPKGGATNAFSFAASSAKENDTKTSTARPSFSFSNVSSTVDNSKEDEESPDYPKTRRTLHFGDDKPSAAKPTAKPLSKPAPAKTSRGVPSSQMEGQLWKLIIDFDKSFQRVNQSSKCISSKDPEFTKKLLADMDTLRAQVSSLCGEINKLDDLRDQIEKDVLFVIGSDGDVHEQLEYGREILRSFNDEALKRTLEEQPLDQRSKETWDSLKSKLDEVEKSCAELDSHLSSSKIGVEATSSTHLFRVLKQTYDTSKAQYNKVCKLAENLEKLTLRGDRLGRSYGVSGITSGESELQLRVSKEDIAQVITETEQRSQDVRRHFLTLCNNVVTPRDVFSVPRRKVAPPTPSDSASPLRIKACSKLMPKTQLSVASPMSSAKQPSRSISFKDTPVKAGSKLFTLAEAMAPKEPAKFVQTPQPSKASVGVGKAPQRPSLGGPSASAEPASTTSSATGSKSNVFSFPKPAQDKPSATPSKKRASPSFGGAPSFGVSTPPVKPKAKTEAVPTASFSLGGKEAPLSTSSFSFGAKDASKSLASAGSAARDYKALLEQFYKVHNSSKNAEAIEKALATYKGREEDLFTRLFTMYAPDSSPDDVKKYLNGGPVPAKMETPSSKASTTTEPAKSAFGSFGASTTSKEAAKPSPFGAAKPSPFGAAPSAFSLGPSASTSSGFGGFGSSGTSSATTATASPFGKPAVDYRQKLVEFYQKHNPEKLSSVDTTLLKYKGREDKLFENLNQRYKVNGAGGVPPASPAVQPANTAAASPFGKPGAFSAPNASGGAAFGSTSSVGFGVAKPPSASPFGAPAQTSNGFGSAGSSAFGGGFQASSTPTIAAFGSPSPFGAATGGFGSGGVDYRQKLTEFYQKHNPNKLGSVDATLEKYKGREDRLFAMLEQKYLGKSATPATGGFGTGIPSTNTFGVGGGFGTPSAIGANAAPAPAFGSASSLGGAAQPAFGNSSGFGQASSIGGGFGPAAPAASPGAATGSGFGAFNTQTPTFGSTTPQAGGFGGAAQSGGFGGAAQSGGFGGAAQGGAFGGAAQGGGFGGAAPNGGFGSGFGGAAAGGFGQPAAFSGSSFTQMR